MNINDETYAKTHEQCKTQANAYEELLGGRRAMMGNAWDPWNVLGISWSIYNDFKNKGYNERKIYNIVHNSHSFHALDVMKQKVEDYKMRM